MRPVAWIAGLLLSMLFPVMAAAGSFTVSPVRLELSPQRPLGSLTITNDASEPVTVDAKAMVWSQANGEDLYEDTRELIVTPPVFTLEPKASQILRLGLRRGPDPERELAFRVFLTENAPPVTMATTGIAMTLRLAVPVFIRPKAPPVAKLDWSAQRSPDGSLLLRANNVGNLHVQVSDLRLKAGNDVIARQTNPAYLLPGQAREWSIKPEAGRAFSAQTLTLEGNSDAGDVRAELPLR